MFQAFFRVSSCCIANRSPFVVLIVSGLFLWGFPPRSSAGRSWKSTFRSPRVCLVVRTGFCECVHFRTRNFKSVGRRAVQNSIPKGFRVFFFLLQLQPSSFGFAFCFFFFSLFENGPLRDGFITISHLLEHLRLLVCSFLSFMFCTGNSMEMERKTTGLVERRFNGRFMHFYRTVNKSYWHV